MTHRFTLAILVFVLEWFVGCPLKSPTLIICSFSRIGCPHRPTAQTNGLSFPRSSSSIRWNQPPPSEWGLFRLHKTQFFYFNSHFSLIYSSKIVLCGEPSSGSLRRGWQDFIYMLVYICDRIVRSQIQKGVAERWILPQLNGFTSIIGTPGTGGAQWVELAK